MQLSGVADPQQLTVRRATHPPWAGAPDTPRPRVAPRSTIPACRVRYPLIFDDLTFPNDVIRREHSPPSRQPA